MTFEELEQQIVRWADERDILVQSDSISQLAVTIEECSELLKALNTLYAWQDCDDLEATDKVINDVVDAYGDILVTLIVGHAIFSNKESLVAPLELAYDQIKDRKGRMINGKFVKEA